MRTGATGTLAALLLAACGSEQSPKADDRGAPEQTSGAASNNLAAPIVEAPATNNVDARSDRIRKPLVSRETSEQPSPAEPASALPPPPPADEYRAIGTEPFWAVTVRNGQLSLERPSGETLRLAVTRTEGRGVIRYAGEGFSMNVTPGPCSDGMSNAMWADRVQIAFADGALKGCGGAREDMEDSPIDDN